MRREGEDVSGVVTISIVHCTCSVLAHELRDKLTHPGAAWEGKIKETLFFSQHGPNHLIFFRV